MTKRKHEAYTLWLKFIDEGWRPELTVKDTNKYDLGPRYKLKQYFKYVFYCNGKTAWNYSDMKILPEGLEPRA